jgi:chromosome segregation ATPase
MAQAQTSTHPGYATEGEKELINQFIELAKMADAAKNRTDALNKLKNESEVYRNLFEMSRSQYYEISRHIQDYMNLINEVLHRIRLRIADGIGKEHLMEDLDEDIIDEFIEEKLDEMFPGLDILRKYLHG